MSGTDGNDSRKNPETAGAGVWREERRSGDRRKGDRRTGRGFPPGAWIEERREGERRRRIRREEDRLAIGI